MERNYRYLSQAVNQALEDYGFTPIFLSGHLSAPMRLTPSGFNGYLRNVRNGDIYGIPNQPNDLKKSIKRLEILLYGLNLHLNQELVGGLNKRIESGLIFPPENGIPHDKLVEEYRAYEAIKNSRKAAKAGLELRV